MQSKIKNFPTLAEIKKIKETSNYRKLYNTDQLEVLGLHDIIRKQFASEKTLVYIPNPLPFRISEFYGDFVAGETDRMVIKAGTGKEEDETLLEEMVYENDIKEKISDWAVDQSKEGSFVLYTYVDADGVSKLEQCPLDQYFPQSDGSVIFASYIKDPEDKMGVRLLLYTQHYYMEGGMVKIKREAFKTDDTLQASEEYPLTSMALILGVDVIVAEETIESLDELPIRAVKNGMSNKSDYYPITPQLSEINERTTQLSVQFLKNLDAKMVLPKSMQNEKGEVPPFDIVLMASKDDVEPKFMTNTNGLMSESNEHVLNQVRLISIATGVPMFELLKSTQPESVESLKINFFSAIRRTDRKRAKIKRALLDMFRIMFKMQGRELDQDVIMKFSDVLPTDNYVEAEIENIKLTAGLTSKKSAMMRLENYSEEEADEELAKIQEENALTGFDAFGAKSIINNQ